MFLPENRDGTDFREARIEILRFGVSSPPTIYHSRFC
jgi:hypothetical protein